MTSLTVQFSKLKLVNVWSPETSNVTEQIGERARQNTVLCGKIVSSPVNAPHFCEIAPGQNGACALVGRHFRNQLAGVTGRPIGENRSVQVAERDAPCSISVQEGQIGVHDAFERIALSSAREVATAAL